MYISKSIGYKTTLRTICLLFYIFRFNISKINIQKNEMQKKKTLNNKRTSHRVPASAVTFIKDETAISGFTIDISESGVRIEVPDSDVRKNSDLILGIPLLHDQNINGEIRWHKNSAGNMEYGIRFKDLSAEQKMAIRKSILIDDSLIFQSAQNIADGIDDPDIKEKIKIFFLIELKTKLEKLIDICFSIEASNSDITRHKEYTDIIEALKENTMQLKQSVKNSSLIEKIEKTVTQLLGNLAGPSDKFGPVIDKPAV